MAKFIKLKIENKEHIMNVDNVSHICTDNNSYYTLRCINGYWGSISKEEYNRIAQILLEEK